MTSIGVFGLSLSAVVLGGAVNMVRTRSIRCSTENSHSSWISALFTRVNTLREEEFQASKSSSPHLKYLIPLSAIALFNMGNSVEEAPRLFVNLTLIPSLYSTCMCLIADGSAGVIEKLGVDPSGHIVSNV